MKASHYPPRECAMMQLLGNDRGWVYMCQWEPHAMATIWVRGWGGEYTTAVLILLLNSNNVDWHTVASYSQLVATKLGRSTDYVFAIEHVMTIRGQH